MQPHPQFKTEPRSPYSSLDIAQSRFHANEWMNEWMNLLLCNNNFTLLRDHSISLNYYKLLWPHEITTFNSKKYRTTFKHIFQYKPLQIISTPKYFRYPPTYLQINTTYSFIISPPPPHPPNMNPRAVALLPSTPYHTNTNPHWHSQPS